MRSVLLLFIVSAAVISCETARSEQAVYEYGVVINGVRWATRNVDAPGTFAVNPEDAGMFFQWNRRRGYASTGILVSGWLSTNPTGVEWERENDPCPEGWRVPTNAELASLIDAHYRSTTKNGVRGNLYGIPPNQVFLPAAGRRYHSTGMLENAGTQWGYWSRSPRFIGAGINAEIAPMEALAFWGSISTVRLTSTRIRGTGLSVRCVADEEHRITNRTSRQVRRQRPAPIDDAIDSNYARISFPTQKSYEPGSLGYRIQQGLEIAQRLSDEQFLYLLSLIAEYEARIARAAARPTVPIPVYIIENDGEHLRQQYGVVIEGVRWATSNVDAPGTFAANIEDAGMFFQWNRRYAWSSTGENVSNWDGSMPSGTSWTRDNDPCPTGWRVPTYEELVSLRSAGNVRASLRGVNGMLFGIEPYQIFLPAVGRRCRVDGTLSEENLRGNYWSSSGSERNNEIAMRLGYWSGGLSVSSVWREFGHSVRCVAE